MALRLRTRIKPKADKPARQDAGGPVSARARWTASPRPGMAGVHVHFGHVALTEGEVRARAEGGKEGEDGSRKTDSTDLHGLQSEPDTGTRKDLAEPLAPLPPGDFALSSLSLLKLAISSPSQELPQRSKLEDAFRLPLGDVSVHRGPAAQTALDQLDTPAAVFEGKILLGDADPSLHVLAHEVVHVLQARRAVADSATDAEAEAQTISQRVDLRADAGGDLETRSPLIPSAGVIMTEVAAFSDPPARDEDPTTTTDRAPNPDSSSSSGSTQDTADPSESPAATAAEPTTDAGAPVEEGSPLEAPNPPPPGVDSEAVAARAEELAQAQAALEAADSTDGVMDAYVNAPPTLKAQMAGSLGSRINGVMASEAQTMQEETPNIEANLSHDAPPEGEALTVTSPDAVVNVEPQSPGPAPEIDLPPTPEPGRFTANNGVVDAAIRGEPDQTDRARQVEGALEDVRTTDPGIPTQPAELPTVPLEGETDPQRLQNQLAEGKDQGRSALSDAQAAVIAGPGPERVQPISVHESHPVDNLITPTVDAPPAPEGADAYVGMNLPPEVQTSFDQNNAAEMQASLGEAQTQITQATDARDEQHQSAVDDAQSQNQTLLEQADEDQRNRVGEARTQIQNERQRTIDDQAAAVRGVEDQAGERRRQDRSDIDTRVERDEGAVQNRYDRADREAQSEIESGESRAEDRQRQAERDAENQSWWDRAVNFIRDAFNALVSAIGAIFDAVRAAVNVILDAARDFAIGLINAVSSFIQSAIAAFGDFLTGLVQGLLGDLFPELAARLTQAINDAVSAAQQAVEGVAEGLRQGVNALVEGLRAAINAVLDAFQAAINGALAILEAAITGDWGALARRVLEAVLSLLGIDPQAFYAFIGQVTETFSLIIDNPGGFLGNVLGAVTGGIQAFADHFLQHLQAGIIGWLTGALGGAGITLPERFDLMGVLSLVQQILGLTWENVRERAVRLVGERAVQVLEFIGSYIQTLITGGWSALWERIQSDLATLRDMVFEQIRNFLVERVVLAAIQWLASFNPIGGIVKIVMTVYNFFMFLRDQLQRLFALAQTVIGALSDIVRGNLAPAMQAVEGVLAGLLPVVIDLLARILGLGNVGGRVREIMQNIQQTLWGAIDRLLDRALASFRGGGGAGAGAQGTDAGAGQPAAAGAAAAITEIGERVDVPAHAGGHSLYIVRSGRNAVPMVASTPMGVPDRIAGWRQDVADRQRGDAVIPAASRANPVLDRAERQYNELDGIADRRLTELIDSENTRVAGEVAARSTPPGPAAGATPAARSSDIVGKEQALATTLAQLFDLFGDTSATGLERQFEGNIAMSHRLIQPGLREAVQALQGTNPTGITTWANVQEAFRTQNLPGTAGHFHTLIQEPFNQASVTALRPFTEYVHDTILVEQLNAARAADAELGAIDLGNIGRWIESQKSFMNRQQNGFNRSPGALRTLIYENSAEARVKQIVREELASRAGDATTSPFQVALTAPHVVQLVRAENPTDPSWMAVFAAGGRRVEAQVAHGRLNVNDPIRLEDALGPAGIQQATTLLTEAFFSSLQRSTPLMTIFNPSDAELRSLSRWAADRIVQNVRSREIFYVRPTDIPRNIPQNVPYVKVNPAPQDARSIASTRYSNIVAAAVENLDLPDREIHHFFPLYAGGGNEELNLAIVYGGANDGTTPHGRLHAFFDTGVNITRYLGDPATLGAVTLSVASLERTLGDRPEQLNVLIGTLLATGEIRWRDTGVRLVPSSSAGGSP